MTNSSYYWEHGANPFERTSTATAPVEAGLVQFDGAKFNNVSFAAAQVAAGLLAEKVAEVTLTSAEVLALNATPITVVAAPGAGFANIIKRVTITKAAGTAYADVAAGDDLAIKYTNASGSVAATAEMTGFADSTSATITHAVGASCLPVANAVLVAHMLTGEIATGDSDFKLRITYETVAVPVF